MLRIFACKAVHYSTVPRSRLSISELVKQDHRHIGDLYQTVKSAAPTSSEKKQAAFNLIRAIAIHSHAEELTVYPQVEKQLGNGHVVVDHSLAEHNQVKRDLYLMEKMLNKEDSAFDAQLELVMTHLNQHIKEEEEYVLAELDKICLEEELQEMGDSFEKIKSKVPTHPHPWAPDRPPLETWVGLMQAVLDKTYDAFKQRRSKG